MALAYGEDKLSLKKTTVKVTVPNNPKAYLMYYIDCICNTLQLDSSDNLDINKYRDYENCYSLSESDSRLLLQLAKTLSPSVFKDKVIFNIDSMCHDFENEFYSIESVSNILVASRSIVIGGHERRVAKIMTYKQSWLREHYYTPIREMEQEIEENIRRRQRQIEENHRRQREKDDSCVIL